ncbi:lipopolysaccharide biosynthesis protein [Rhodospirillaceae bacterium SYSU D60014]|uniref:lipopolysaccharide biosynthesis protein n=1 Tax=Virgifigura deserti TaxID=2268457 RepID=UPI000E6683A0
MTGRRAAARSLVWSALESGGLSGLMLITAIVLARLLGPAEFGIAALALGIVQLLNLVVEMLFHDAIVQRKQLDEAHLDTALWTCMGLAVVLVCGCWLAAPLLADLFDEPTLGSILGWMSLSLLFSSSSGVLLASFRRELRFKPVALRSLCGRVCGAAIGITMAFSGFGVWSLVAQNVASSAFAALWVWASATRRPKLRYSFARLDELLRFAIPVFLSQFILQSKIRLFAVLVGYFLGVTAFGYFNIATKLIDTLRFILTNAVSHVALVMFSRIQHDRAKLRRGFMEATEMNAVVTVPIFAGIFVCAPEMVGLILGAQWMPSALLVQILALGAIGTALRQFTPVVYKALGRPQLVLVASIGGFVITITGLLLFGRESIVIATVVSAGQHVFTLPMSLWLLHRSLGIGFLEQFRGAGVPLLAAALMVASLFALKAWLLVGWSDILVLAAIVPTGAVIYIGTVMLAAPRSGLRLFNFFREGTRKGAAPSVAADAP